jgi:hypothetical protein
MDPRDLVAGRSGGDGHWYLVNALHRDARVHSAGPRRLSLADCFAVTDAGHSRFGDCTIRSEPAENGSVPGIDRKCPDGRGYCEHALRRNGRHAFTGHMSL